MGVLSSLAAKITNLGIPVALKNINIANIANLMPISVRDQAVNIALEESSSLGNRDDSQPKEATVINTNELTGLRELFKTLEIEKHQAPIISETKINEELVIDDLRDLYKHSAEISEKYPQYVNHSPEYQALKSAMKDSRHRPPVVAQTGKPLSNIPPAYSLPSAAEYEKLMSSINMQDISEYSGPAGRTPEGNGNIAHKSDNLSTTSNRGNKVFDAPPAYSEKLAKLSVEADLPQELTKSGLRSIEKKEKNEHIKAGSTPITEGIEQKSRSK